MSGLQHILQFCSVPVSLSPLSLDQELFLVSDQGLASGQLLKVTNDREVKPANFYEVVFFYTVLKVCFSARHTQLSWKNVDALHPALCPLSLSYFWTKHLAELCQEIMWALPSEIMPNEGCKWPWISGNSLLMPQQGMMQSPLQSCFLGKKSMLTMHWSLLWCSAGVCRKLCF